MTAAQEKPLVRLLKDIRSQAKSGLPIDEASLVYPVLNRLVELKTAASDAKGEGHSTVEATQEIKEALEAIGAKTYLTPVTEKPFVGSGQQHQGLVALFGGQTFSDARDAFVLSAHIDTVPANHTWLDHWTDDQGKPTKGSKDAYKIHVEYSGDRRDVEPKDIKLIGRGVLDMKGSLAGMLVSLAIKAPVLENSPRPVVLALSSGEEFGMRGADEIAQVMKEQRITPKEILVGEPTDGFLGRGNKGGLLREVEINAVPNEGVGKQHDKALRINIEMPGFHAAMLGSILDIDPAKAALEIYKKVKDLRTKNYDVEVSAVHFGLNNIAPSDKSSMEISFSGTAAQQQEIEKAIQGTVQSIVSEKGRVAKVANAVVSRATPILANAPINAVSNVGKLFSGVEFGKMSVTVDTAASVTPCMKSGRANAAEHALDYAHQVLIKKPFIPKKVGMDKGYPFFPMGATDTDAFVSWIRGDTKRAVLYPASLTSKVMPPETIIKGFEDIEQAIARPETKITGALRFSTPHFEEDPVANQAVLSSYYTAAKNSGFKVANPQWYKVPFPSDANVLKQHFPDSLILDIAAGGQRGSPHGKNENVTLEEMAQNVKLFSALIDSRALGKQIAPAKQPAASAGRQA